jgi:hypothetical protein
MGDIRLDPTETAEWLQQSEDLIKRITAGLARSDKQAANTRHMLRLLDSSCRVVRKVDRRKEPSES